MINNSIDNTSIYRNISKIKEILFSLYENLSSRNRRVLDKTIDITFSATSLFFETYMNNKDIDEQCRLVERLWISLCFLRGEMKFLLDQIYKTDNKSIPSKRLDNLLETLPRVINDVEKWKLSLSKKKKKADSTKQQSKED